MSEIESIVSDLASFLWGLPLLLILIGGGLFLLIYSRLIQFKYFFHAIDILRGKLVIRLACPLDDSGGRLVG